MKSYLEAWMGASVLATRGRQGVLLDNPIPDHSRNVEVVELQVTKVAVAVDAHVGELDPVRLDAGLLEVVDDTVVVGGVHASLAGGAKVRHLGELGQLAGGLGLEVAPAQGQGVVAVPHLFQLRGVRDRRVVGQGGVGEAPGPDGRARVERGAVVPKGLRRVLQVDVAGHQVRAVVGQQDGILRARRVRDEVRRADQLEQVAARGAHGQLAHGPVAGEGNHALGKLLKVRVASLTSARPLRVIDSLRVGGIQLWRRKARLHTVDTGGVPEDIFRGVLLGRSADASVVL
jgi:hypothetical protein